MKKVYKRPEIVMVRVEETALLENSPSIEFGPRYYEEGDADEAWAKDNNFGLWGEETEE